MITDEQAIQVKKQVMQHIEESFPKDKIDAAKRKIATMNNEQLEDFLKQNQKMQEGGTSESPFRAIVSGQIPSYKIGETEQALAVLEINPISKGHTIIIPKNLVGENKKILKSITSFAEKIANQIKKKLNPKEIQISEAIVLGEKILNLLPIYNDETINSERKNTGKEELEQLQKELEKTKRKEVIKKSKPKKVEIETLRLPKRIP